MAEGGSQRSERFAKAIQLAKADAKNGPAFYGPKDKWQAQEELILLTSMKHFGYGNWARHAEVLTQYIEDKEFNAEEVRDHYIKTYKEGEIAEALKPLSTGLFKSSIVDHVSEKNFERLCNPDIDCYKNVPKEFLEEIGYVPLRQDFKQEYEPAAECLLEEWNIKNADIWEKPVYLLMMDCYKDKVKERLRIKKIIQEYELVKRFYVQFGHSEKQAVNHDNMMKVYPDNKEICTCCKEKASKS